MTTLLLLHPADGSPIAPIQQHLKTADGFITTAEYSVTKNANHIEQADAMMQFAILRTV